MKRTLKFDAKDGKAMTLGELRAIVNDTAVLIDDVTEVRVRVTFGGGIKSISITEDPPPLPEPLLPTSPWN